MEAQKLKVGDKVYSIEHEQWGNNIYYIFATVERITKTQAILSNGVRLINEPKNNYHNNIGYQTFGDSWKWYHIQTVEAIEESKKENKRQDIVRWFKNKKFTEEEQFLIYDTFKNIDKL
jgi:hypothetical protein